MEKSQELKLDEVWDKTELYHLIIDIYEGWATGRPLNDMTVYIGMLTGLPRVGLERLNFGMLLQKFFDEVKIK